MSYFDRNIECIRENNKDLYEGIINYTEYSKDISVFTYDAKIEGQYIELHIDNKIYYMNSIYSPRAEALRIIEKCKDMDPRSKLAFVGFGNGTLARELMNMEDSKAAYIFYEPSPEIFKHVLENYDLTDILNNGKIHIFVEGYNSNKLNIWLNDAFSYSNWKLLFIYTLSKYDKLFNNNEKWFNGLCNDILRTKSAERNTIIEFAEDTLKNSIESLVHLPFATSSYDFLNKFPKDMPAIVVAAGPSLEKNVHYLKEAKNKALIIAVDRAAIYLLNQGIEPDMVCTIDPRKPVHMFDDDRLKDIPLVISPNSNINAINRVEGGSKMIYGTSYELYNTDIFKKYGSYVPAFPVGGSVATFAFYLAVYWEFSRVVLIGQDLATSGNKHHAGEEGYNDSNIPKNMIEVEDIYGGTAYTTPDFYEYVKWYNMQIEHLSDKIEVIDATEGGAKFKGSIIMTLKEVVDNYCINEYDVTAIINGVGETFNDDVKKSIIQDYIKSKDNFKKIKRILSEAVSDMSRGVTLIKRGTYTNRDLDNIEKSIFKSNKLIEESYEAFFFVESSLEEELEMTDDIYDSHDNPLDETIRLYEKIIKYYNKLLETEAKVIPMWDAMIEKVQDKIRDII